MRANILSYSLTNRLLLGTIGFYSIQKAFFSEQTTFYTLLDPSLTISTYAACSQCTTTPPLLYLRVIQTLLSPQTNFHIAICQRQTDRQAAKTVVSTSFLSFNTGRSADHSKDKSYAIFVPILLQRQSAFSALAKRVALAFVQVDEIHPWVIQNFFGKTQKDNKNTENINSKSNIHAIGTVTT